jgi:hypothetical protein
LVSFKDVAGSKNVEVKKILIIFVKIKVMFNVILIILLMVYVKIILLPKISVYIFLQLKNILAKMILINNNFKANYKIFLNLEENQQDVLLITLIKIKTKKLIKILNLVVMMHFVLLIDKKSLLKLTVFN